MTSWRTLVGNSETLTAADLDAVGGRVTATIESVNGAKFEEEDKVDDGRGGEVVVKKVDKKALIAFTGKHLKLAANTINCLLIEQLFGEEIEGWIGHRVTLASEKVEVAGKFKGQPCIRVVGSPELTAKKTVQIKLPRRKPFARYLEPTGNGGKVNPETGEVADDVPGRGPKDDPGAEAAADSFTGPDDAPTFDV